METEKTGEVVLRRLHELGLELPELRLPIGEYVSAVRAGNLLFVSGHGPIRNRERVYIGRLGAELTLEDGREAAKLVILNLLCTVQNALGSLDRVQRVVKLLAFVNSALDFHDQPKVIDSASELLVAVFGEQGRHARSAIGTSVLPFNIAVEIEAVFEIA